MYKLMIEHGKSYVQAVALPDSCPICHYGVSPNYIDARFGKTHNEVEAIFVCPRGECKRVFIGSYLRDGMSGSYYINSILPRLPKPEKVEEDVASLSPQFAEIFIQASQAEAYGLGEVAGVGYRKSLEYLIKDYCSIQNPDKEDDIKSQPVSQVINNFVLSENVKQCARRAIWLGNDETHYVRRWVEKDISDLKLLIRLTVSWIQQEIMTRRLLDEMQ